MKAIPARLALLLVSTFAAVFLTCTSTSAQAKSTPTPDDKAEDIVKRGIEAVGGNSYLNVRTVMGRGLFSQYVDGAPAVPAKFIDYIVYPDRERTEFTSEGIRNIQTNDGGQGWIYDGAVKNIKDQTANQISDYKVLMRTSIENLLRGWWRKDGATLAYVGRREAGLARRNETVRLTYPDAFWVEYEFAAKEGLPAKVIYKRPRKNPDTDAVEDTNEEDRFGKQIVVDGVTVPFVIDHFSNGVQTSRVNYDTIEFNRPVADSLFAKPAGIKNLK